MALPNTGISFTMIRDAIGAGITNLSGLRSSELVNIWGLKPPGEDQFFDANHLRSSTFNAVWGIVDSAPWDAGDFRGYDHYNRCFALNRIIIEGDQTDASATKRIVLESRFFPSWSSVDGSGVWAKYQVWYNNTGDFQHNKTSAGILTVSIDPVTNIGTGYLNINTGAPADSTGYLWVEKCVEVSHDFKWDVLRDGFDIPYTSLTPQGTDLGHGWVVSYEVGSAAVANLQVSVDNPTGTLNKHFDGELYGMRVETSNPGSLGVNCHVEISFKDSSTEVYNSEFTAVVDKYLPAGSANVVDSITLLGPTSHISVGQTLYGKYRINYGTWYGCGSFPVVDSLPEPD